MQWLLVVITHFKKLGQFDVGPDRDHHAVALCLAESSGVAELLSEWGDKLGTLPASGCG